MKTTPTLLVLAFAAMAPSLAMASCGASFCAVNSNWTAESALAEARHAFDLRYEYLNQDQPMAGAHRVYAGEVAAHHDEVSTQNRNVVASYSHNFSGPFGVTISASAVARDHEHIHNHHGKQIRGNWDFTELGDVRVVGRYQLDTAIDPLQPSNAGLTFGIKLPTGKFDVANDHGDKAERSLQPGTGTTDLIIGAYYHRKLPADGLSWFVQGQVQHALNSRDHYRPGSQLGLDFGVRKGVTAKLGVLAQLNFVNKRADHGSEAEPESSGGRYLYASPGLSYAIASSAQLYLFYQVPVQRHVEGVQLTANRALVLGLSGQL